MRIPHALALLLLVSRVTAQSLPAWHAVHEATFGSANDPKTEFSDIRGIGVSTTGNVLVLDFKAQNLRVFSPAGALLKTIGRNGEGPGEFRQPNGMIRAPDGTFWINDFPNRRFSVHRNDGEFARVVPSMLREFGYIWDGQFDAAGRLLLSTTVHDEKAGANDKPRRVLERRAMNGGTTDSVPYPRCMPPSQVNAQHAWIWETKGSAVFRQIPFSASQSIAITRREYAWCTPGSDYTVYRLGLARGDTQVVIHGKTPLVPVSAEERDSAIEVAKETFRKAHADESIIKGSDVPRNRPAVIGLTVDDRDRLWVRLTATMKGHSRYDVYDASGKALGSVDLPVTLSQSVSPVIVGDRLYAVVLDADDVPGVVRFRITATP